MSNYQPILNENMVTKFVELCAWCDADKAITKKYIADGYKASHGICEQHKDEVIKETIEFYEKNGLTVANNDSGVSEYDVEWL